MKLNFLKLILCIAILAVYGCTEDPLLSSDTNSDVTISSGGSTYKTICVLKNVDLRAGQPKPGKKGIDVGNAKVELVKEQETGDKYIKVTYSTKDDWYLSEVHLDMKANAQDFPQTSTGNPKVGHFLYKETFSSLTQRYSFQLIPINEIPDAQDGDCEEQFLVAAHAVVKKVVEGKEVQEETAWGNGRQFNGSDGRNWAMYFKACKTCP